MSNDNTINEAQIFYEKLEKILYSAPLEEITTILKDEALADFSWRLHGIPDYIVKQKLEESKQLLNIAERQAWDELIELDCFKFRRPQQPEFLYEEVIDRIEFLTVFSDLGDKKALKLLVYLGVLIADNIEKLNSSTSSTPSTPLCPTENTDWKSVLFHEIKQLACKIKEDDTFTADLKQIKNKNHCPWLFLDSLIAVTPEISKVDSIISELCNQIVYNRLQSQTCINLSTIASSSGCWPITVHSLPEYRIPDINKYVASIGLGDNAGLGINSRPRRGARRDFRHNSSMSLWIELYNSLENMRSRDLPDDLRISYETDEKSNIGVNCVPSYIQSKTPPSTESSTTEWDVCNIWYRKASLLPELTCDPRSRELWLEAAMAKLDSTIFEYYGVCPNHRKPNLMPCYAGRNWGDFIYTMVNKQHTTEGNLKKSGYIRSAIRERLKQTIKQVTTSYPKT